MCIVLFMCLNAAIVNKSFSAKLDTRSTAAAAMESFCLGRAVVISVILTVATCHLEGDAILMHVLSYIAAIVVRF
jgi:hypothetical protein